MEGTMGWEEDEEEEGDAPRKEVGVRDVVRDGGVRDVVRDRGGWVGALRGTKTGRKRGE